MLFFAPRSLIPILITTVLVLEASFTFASPVESSDSALAPRAPKKQGCAGDFGGGSIGVLSCADVTFLDSNSLSIYLTVRDSRRDSNDVYGWVRVYSADGSYKDLPKLRNDSGYGTTEARTSRWDQAGRITGFRAKACVDDAGTDTCVDGNFVGAP